MYLRKDMWSHVKFRILNSSQPDKSPFSARIFIGIPQFRKWRITAMLQADLLFHFRQKKIRSRLPSENTTQITSWKSPMTTMKRDLFLR